MRSSPWRFVSLLTIVTACGQPAPSPPPSLVVVTIDTLRLDRLGSYGYFRDTSPNLDAFAAEALVFERCIAPMATTFPSHLSLFTSTYPDETGAVANTGGGGQAFVPSDDLRTLAQVLGSSGYHTAAFVSAAPLKRHSGISVGFDVFDEPKGPQRRAEHVNESVLGWLEDGPEDPFFLWVHYFDPHSPYQPPEPFNTRYTNDVEQSAYFESRGFEINDRRLAHNNLYDGEVRYTDDAFGVLLESLRATGSWDDAVVVVMGDHGEALGQHGENEHGGVWSEQLKVPLMIRVPGQEPRRIHDLMSVADVMPTLLGLVELPGGEAFVAQAAGIDRLAERRTRPHVFSQESRAPWRLRGGSGEPRYVLTGDEWKLVYDPNGASQLFRISEDPFELQNVIDSHPGVATKLESVLLARMAQQAARRTRWDSGRATTDEDLDPEILDELRSLGYVK